MQRMMVSLLIAFVLFTPGVVTAFNMMYMPYYAYLIVVGLSLVPLVVMETAKAIKRAKNKN